MKMGEWQYYKVNFLTLTVKCTSLLLNSLTLSLVLCSAWCWFMVITFGFAFLPLSWPFCSPCCYADAVNLQLRILQATSTKFSECRTKIYTAYSWGWIKIAQFLSQMTNCLHSRRFFFPFSLFPSMCREERIKGAVFSFLEKKRSSAFLRCLWFSG